jgi:tRNA (guanine37-N1)-methyltransferase
MTIDIVTIFPRIIGAGVAEGVIARGIAAGLIEIGVHDLRSFTTDRHRSVDDEAYGGGPGMVLKPEPLVRAVEHISATRGVPDSVVLLSPQGRRFAQADAVRLSRLTRLVMLCGRYEGIDERVAELVGAEEVSIGDFVVSGGEVPALAVVDAVCRLVPGVVGDEQSVVEESFARGLLDHPHYTRPAEFAGLRVPEVLVSGHHEAVRRWRKRAALARTLERRPDLLAGASLDEDERRVLEEIRRERQGALDEPAARSGR